MPAIAKILIVFAGMLALSRLRLHLGAALMLGGVAADLWAGTGVRTVASHFGLAWLEAELWLFVGITVLIVDIGRFVTDGSIGGRSIQGS